MVSLSSMYGNPFSEKSVRGAARNFKRYARKFGFDPGWTQCLQAAPLPEEYDFFGIQKLVQGTEASSPLDEERGVILGTIRMGFGHYRISLALASAAASMGLIPYWLDFFAFPDTPASRTIAHLEHLYNAASRISQRSKLFNKYIWEKAASNASLRFSTQAREKALAEIYAPMCSSLPKSMPYIATHPFTGHAAVSAGMRNVVDVVPDNYAIAFNLVDGAIHAVQTPSLYLGYRTLRDMSERGQPPLNPMPRDQIRCVGHFIDHELVANIEADCDRRLRRIAGRKARRILLTMGGAGAQVQRFRDIIVYCRDWIREDRAALFVNMGDHEGRWNELRAALDERGIQYVLHADWKETAAFSEEVLDGEVRGIHVFLHKEMFPAVYSTNLLMRATDVMITKPSELSFYPVPKLFIQRVGRHEAWGAIHSAEIGDGTMETGSVDGVYQSLRVIIGEDDLFTMYCSNIVKNKSIGIYNGAYEAVRIAVGRRKAG